MSRFIKISALTLGAILAVMACGAMWAQSPAATKPLTIEAIYAPGGLGGRGPETVEWSPDGTKLSYVQRQGEQGDLWYMDAATGEKKVLVSAEKLASLAPDYAKVKNEREKERLTRYHVAAYLWAPDSKHLVFDSQGQLWLYDLGTGTAGQLTSAPDPSGDPKFSPDGSRIAYVRKHNLYVLPLNSKNEKELTHDKADDLFNGDIDWVYAEELAVRSNYFWSPDGRDIAFLHMDETKVTTYPITDWMQRHPTVDNEKYPKVGDENPSVKLGVVDADKGKTKWITLTNDDQAYIPRFGWVREGVLWAEVLNRTEDKLDLYFVDTKSGKSRIVLTETTPGAWIDFDHAEVRFLKSSGRFLWPSWRDGNMHLYLYSFDKQNPLAADAKLERQLTQGEFQVGAIEGVDEAAGTVFFAANKDDPRQTHVFSVQLDGSGFKALTSEEGLHFAGFSEDGKHYTHMYFVDELQDRPTPVGVKAFALHRAEPVHPDPGMGSGEMLIDVFGVESPEVGRLLAAGIAHFDKLAGLEFARPMTLCGNHLVSYSFQGEGFLAVEIDVNSHGCGCPALRAQSIDRLGRGDGVLAPRRATGQLCSIGI